MNVVKADGTIQEFSESKLRRSIERSHVPPELHQEALDHIKDNLFDGITTKEIFHHMNEFLTTKSPHSVATYSLKQAIMSLGPTGYPFEDYISQLLTAEGYTTAVRQVLQGTCISHEVDVVAEKNTVVPTKIMIEAKYHNEQGVVTDVHVPMYTKSRFDDLKEKHGFTKAMLVTNTKMTTDAIAFGECVGMELLSWSYPEGATLRDLVEKYQLVPVTALSSLTPSAKEILLNHGIVLCKQICEDPSVLEDTSIPSDIRDEILAASSFACNLGEGKGARG